VRRRRILGLAAGLALLGAPPSPARALQDWDAIPVRVTHVRGDVYAVFGTGANQTAVAGETGLLVVDAGYTEMGERIAEALSKLRGADAPLGVRYLVDTHWHFDHVGANGVYVAAGATVVAQEETARLMSQDRTMDALEGLEVAATPEEARPELTFATEMEIVFAGDTVRLVHAPAAHTGGDAVVYFPQADVVHVGDLFFNGMYPYIDVDYGGSLAGMLAGCDEILGSTGPETIFVPGHGGPASREDFRRYTEMLRTVHERVSGMVARGMTREELVATKPTADLDTDWSRGGGFNEPDFWVGLVYDGYVRQGIS